MKKVKIIVAAILRGVLLITPGSLLGWWAWSKAPALIAIMAAVGLETLFLILFSFVAVAIQARKDLKRQKTEEEEIAETAE